MSSNKRGTIFFDYDGTLHNSMLTYGSAFREAYAWLVDQGYAKPQEFSDEEISHWLGWTVEKMWNAFMPELPEPVWRHASRMIGKRMEELTKEGKAGLFPGVKEMLTTLHDQNYELIFLSNCGRAYRDQGFSAFGIGDLFDGSYVAQDFDYCPKWEIYQQIAAEHPYPHVMVGDRFHDLEVAQKGGIPFIGCRYGFGLPSEIEYADVLVDAPHEIPQAVEELFSRA